MEKVRFPGNRGLVLCGDLHMPDNGNNFPCLVVCHGFRGSKEGSGCAAVLADKLAGLGIMALRFDFAGTGESAGDFADVTLSGYIQDLAAALDFISTVTQGKLIVLGRSFGGTTAICEASHDRRVAAVCTWAAPVDLEETFIKPARPLLDKPGGLFEITGESGHYLLKRGFFEDLLNHNVIAAAGKIPPRPILIVHGTADETVSFSQGVRLYESLGGQGSKLFIEGADHRFLNTYELVERETIGWAISII